MKNLPTTETGAIDIGKLVHQLITKNAPERFVIMAEQAATVTNESQSWDAIGMRQNVVLQDAADWNEERLYREATHDEVIEFGQFVCKALNTIYGDSGVEKREYMVIALFESNEAYRLELGYKPAAELPATIAINRQKEIDTEYAIEYHRNQAFFNQDKRLINWIKSSALVGADKMFSDLIKAGY